MIKTRKNVPISLKQRTHIINLEQINLQPFIIVGLVIMVLIISVLCVAAYPNSNVPMNI
ncbi:MAG: hypothetical protein HZC47_04365 [Methanobacterium sp.]|uniref:hypothetical protein n=1 Tax=Methanobacterium sp. TaxID=2164 RepID=UPI003D659FC7|nr:hypothetical protein [Methanobacterium sp.]